MMADIQEYFVREQIRNFYSVSISGYHIAEAGANPISQLAFTLANGFLRGSLSQPGYGD
ncbi:MAG: methylmalonyl-CoA mutase family protein [Candidatus Competibacteraceae bacterium]